MTDEQKSQELIDYLLEVLASMEKERRRRMSYSDFAILVDLPLRTVTSIFEGRKPIKANAEKIAIALGSNRIMDILGYERIDPTYLRFRRALKQLPPEQQAVILKQVEAAAKNAGEGVRVLA